MSATEKFRRSAYSYEHGVSEIPLAGVTIGNLLSETAARIPDNEALVVPYQNARLTWRDLEARAVEAASGLLALGLEPGL